MFSLELNLTRSWRPFTFFYLRETQRGCHVCRPQKEPAKPVLVVVPLPTSARSLSTVLGKRCTYSVYLNSLLSVLEYAFLCHFSCSFWVISKKRRGKYWTSHSHREPGEHSIFSPPLYYPPQAITEDFTIPHPYKMRVTKSPILQLFNYVPSQAISMKRTRVL